ncbi:sensor histidine kinase [Streptomyces sp. NPDC048172]|uniref:sensor histidine kinase n=1 Tax=Streptomyces sp. NPDC048172 TaxID=3365505 RepID=UPI00371FCE46
MVSADSPPGEPRSASVTGWLLPPVFLALGTAVTMLLAPSEVRPHVAWIGGAATVAVAAVTWEAVRRGRELAGLRRRFAERDALLCQYLNDQQAETERLARKSLPAAIAKLQQGIPFEESSKGTDVVSRVSPGFEAAHKEVLRATLYAVETEENLKDSAQRAFVNIARRVQAIVHQQAYELRELEDKHGNDPNVFHDLLRLDHRTALIGRLADSIAVLGGARPGRQWKNDIPLFNVLRGAMSRITDYSRVNLHSVAEVGITGPGVEPLIHAVAELLDNATRYSPPETKVHLTATEVQNGVAVEIEDAGVGLTDEARRRAEESLAQATTHGIDLDDLGETPRLGLAVVGRLAHTNRYKIALRSSAYGGVRVVLIVPPDVVCVTPVPGGDIARAQVLPPPKHILDARRRAAEAAEAEPAATGAAGATSGARTTNGLPQRRRRSRAAVPSMREWHAAGNAGSTAGSSSHESAEKPPPPPGLWLAAFHEGISGEPDIGSSAPRSHGPSDEESEQ